MRTAFFDVDGTLVRGATGMLALDVFRRAGYITHLNTMEAVIYHLLHRVGLMNAEDTYRKAIQPFVGHRVDEVARHVAECYRGRIRPAIYQRAVELAQEHHARGERVVLLSASSALLLEHFRDALPVDHILAFTQQSEAGRFIDAYERPVPYGRNKLLLAEHFLADHGGSLRESTYYADSITDLHLLEVVGSPKPVNPDLRLQRAAEKRGWPILRFYDVLGPGLSSGPP